MRVLLAGHNVDRDVLDELQRKAPPRLDVTPETLSASYARISRDPRPVDELRRAAREEVEKARRSNQSIIFKMGHHSVAEHAVFNFDLIGLSRLAIEEIERFRLVSFTEKSQRYITLGDDYVLPEEVVSAGGEARSLFVETVLAQNAFYHTLLAKLRPYVFETNPDLAANPKKHNILDGWAKEDARYAVSLATEGQLGMTVNARNLELMIRRFAARPLAEVRELGRRMFELAGKVAPSILLFTEATEHDAVTYGEFAAAARKALGGEKEPGAKGGREVRFLRSTTDGDDRVLAALLESVFSLPYEKCLADAKALAPRRKRGLFLRVFERMEFYDFPPREFEHADLTFDLVVSASCFAQLKRHRMVTLTVQAYDPALGVTVPPSIEAVGAKAEFLALVERTDRAYEKLRAMVGPEAAAYVLTNAHRRRALLKVNVRELYHIARLREDASAQWDIRRISAKMSALARRALPLSCLMLGAKDAYPAIYEKVFGRRPKLEPAGFRK